MAGQAERRDAWHRVAHNLARAVDGGGARHHAVRAADIGGPRPFPLAAAAEAQQDAGACPLHLHPSLWWCLPPVASASFRLPRLCRGAQSCGPAERVHGVAVLQVQYGAIWDLLTSQCDRHSENIFIDESGNLQFIDNDKALGVVSTGYAERHVEIYPISAIGRR